MRLVGKVILSIDICICHVAFKNGVTNHVFGFFCFDACVFLMMND